jgi:chemotaxis protein MotA
VFSIVGSVVVLGCLAGGYLIEKGNLLVLMQPVELLTTAGAALGSVSLLIRPTFRSRYSVASSGCSREAITLPHYTLIPALPERSLRHISQERPDLARTGSAEPEKSGLFKRHPISPSTRKRCSSSATPCERRWLAAWKSTIRTGDGDGPGGLHYQSILPVKALNTEVDKLPGLGIVAAVLGVVRTMGSLGGPPEEIGHKVAAALVGTFLGILLC